MRLTLHLSALAIPFFAAGVLAQDVACESDADCGDEQICALTDCARPCDDGDVDCEPVDCGGGGVCIDVGGGAPPRGPRAPPRAPHPPPRGPPGGGGR